MSYSASLEGNQRNFRLRVISELLTQGKLLGIEAEALIEFFTVQAQNMMNYKNNFNINGDRIWVMRGFYPGTPLFFKLSVIEHLLPDQAHGSDTVSAKASPLRVHNGGRHSKWDKVVTFDANEITDNITNKMENAFFNANHVVKPILRDKITMPRCMAPKGMKLLRYKKAKV